MLILGARYWRSSLVAVAAGVAAGLTVIALVVSAASAMSPHPLSAARAAGASLPTLGIELIAGPNGGGFGQVEPQTISYGGDPTSLVVTVRWNTWGGPRAIGHGTADWVWPGWCVACGSVELPATVVAFGLTSCQGQSAYSKVEWYFPSRGMSFSPRAGGNICSHASTPSSPPNELKCGSVSLPSQGPLTVVATNINVYASPISCAAARQFVAGSGFATYINRNARISTHGWWCGSQVSMGLPGSQLFSCERGDFTNLSFNLETAGE